MSRGYYDPVLSKTDPLLPRHIKLPRSVVATLARAGRKRARTETFIHREAMMAWAREWQLKNPPLGDDTEAGGEFEDARGKEPKKRKKQA